MTDVERTTQSITARYQARGFALPTILITSIIMLMVMLVSVSSTTAVRTAMKAQYYQQLARVAGEAGIAYAQACLSASAGIPTWNNAQPLKPNTDCTGFETTACPTTSTNPLCSVTLNGNVRSNFMVGPPSVDANGRATYIPNYGFVEILRSSNSAVWRTYQQSSAASAFVSPDLCSGSATTALGWSNAVVYTPTDAFPESLAMSIGISNGNVKPGPIYLRRDFNVVKAGVYTLNVKGDSKAEASVDGSLLASATYPTVGTAATANLTVGCHAVTAKLTNGGIFLKPAKLTLSLKLVGASSPTVVSDTSWRVSTGKTVNFSTVRYYADPVTWTAAKDLGAYNGSAYWGAGPVPDWAATSGIASSRWISPVAGFPTYPASQFAFFRDSRTITVATPTTVKVSYACDDTCEVWLDGNVIASTAAGGMVAQTTTVILSEGSHQFGVYLGNGVAGPAGFLFGVQRTSDNATLSLSDTTWTTPGFTTAVNRTPSSYDNSFIPTPVN